MSDPVGPSPEPGCGRSKAIRPEEPKSYQRGAAVSTKWVNLGRNPREGEAPAGPEAQRFGGSLALPNRDITSGPSRPRGTGPAPRPSAGPPAGSRGSGSPATFRGPRPAAREPPNPTRNSGS